ncbi:hypothetical protein DFQ26_007173 [Actinomortierella ambigua]|nr:hypothetical protein DFQ26_007173 [Actinomortierella ambigua]
MSSSYRRGERTSKYFSQSSDPSADVEGAATAADDDGDDDKDHDHDHDRDHDEDERSATFAAVPSTDPAAAPPFPKKKGRKPKPRPEGEPEKPVKPRKPRGPNKVPKEPKEPKVPKAPKEPKVPKEKKVKEPKEPKVRKNAKNRQDVAADAGGAAAPKNDRSILNYFDKTSPSRSNGPSDGPSANDDAAVQDNATDGKSHSAGTTKSGAMSFKQSCLSFDVIDSSNPGAYFLNQPYDDVNPFRHLLKELPKLVGRAPYEDLSDGMLARSARIPALRTFDVTFADFDMNTLAEVKMIHEFLNTFGTPLSLTEEEGEWIKLESLVSMLRNPKIDDRLVDLQCQLVRAAYEPAEAPHVDQYNFIYYLAVGPEHLSGNDDKRDAKTARALARAVRLGRPRKNAAIRRRRLVLDRLGGIEYSEFTLADRIQSLTKAIHDIMSTPKFHRFMTNEVEENILTLKRQKRKRTEARKELETQTQELERSMRAIERQAAELESQKQALLALERDGTPGEEEQVAAAGRSSVSRLQRLAQTKEARAKVAALTNEQKALAHELKLKESMCDSKREELEGVVEDDFEVQKDHNVILNRLRGGNVVNTDDNLRVMVLGSDRFGRKYWFWKGFGGVIVEDRGQVGPKEQVKGGDEAETKADTLDGPSKTTTTITTTTTTTTNNTDGENDVVMEEVITRMGSMATCAANTKSRMSINSLLIDTPAETTSDENGSNENPDHESQSATPELLSPHPPVVAATPASHLRPFTERDLLDYGAIQTWSLISSNKELASLIRVLNHKGTRERILKANLLTMRKQIETSFAAVEKWAHVADANEPRNAADGGGDLILEALRKKRGRKSKEELAEIAARMESLEATAAAAAAAAQANAIRGANAEGEPLGEPEEAVTTVIEADHDMELEDAGGATGEEYYDGMVHQTEGKLCALSAVLCEGNQEDALSKFVNHARTIVEGEDLLKVSVGCLKLCLEALKESVEEVEEMEADEEDHPTDATKAAEGVDQESKTSGQASSPIVKKEAKEQQQHMSEVDTDEEEEEEEPVSTLIASPELLEKIRMHPSVVEGGIPVAERPKLYWWLKARRVDEMLDAVQTYGGLYAWLEVSKRAVESMVDEGDHGDDDDEDAHRSGDEDEEGEDADEHEHDDQDDEDGEEDEQGDDDEDADEAGDDKSQEHEEEEAEEEEEPRRGRSRHSKAKKQAAPGPKLSPVANARGTRASTRSVNATAGTPAMVTAGGISLRSRRGPRVNYNDDAARYYQEYEEQEEEDEDEDEDEDTPRLRRSKRRRH